MLIYLILPVAYLVGAIPFGYLLVRLGTGKDVRAAGSGNIGATNVLRTSGRLAGITTLVLDILKGTAAVWMAAQISHGDAWWTSGAAVAAMVGHAYPVFLRFRGGKAVATFVGAFLYLTPLPLGATMVVFGGVVARSRYVSLGSVVGAAVFPLAVWLIEHPPMPVVFAAVLGGMLVIHRHKENVRRLREGKEHVLSLGGHR
jgi:acyl phosphate:glycerol-3-phosphate acyltransferase